SQALDSAAQVVADDLAAVEIGVEAHRIGVDAALALGDASALDMVLGWADALPPLGRGPVVAAGHARLLAATAHRGGDEHAATAHESEAIDTLRAIGARPALV